MADISEGLSANGVAPTGDTFEADLAAKFESVGGDLVTTDTSGDAATEPATAPERDPASGRFVPKEEAAAPATPETPATEPAADTSTGDPAVDAYLAKYGGDVDAAVKAAAHQSDVIGRQGQELGQTREELAKLQGIVETLQRQPVQSGPVMTTDQVEEYAVEVSTSKGYYDGATALVNESLKSGDERAYDTLLRNWTLEDPIAATRYDGEFQAWKRAQAAPAPEAAAPVVDPRLAPVLEAAEVNSMAAVIGIVAQERGESWAAVAPFMDAALEQVHSSVLALVASDVPEDRLAGTRMIADKAQLLALSGAGKTPAQIAAEAATARKNAASQAIASGSLRPAEEAAGSPKSREEAIAVLKRSIVESDTTSVADGLTYAK